MLPKESLGTFFAIMHLDWMKCAERHTISRLAECVCEIGCCRDYSRPGWKTKADTPEFVLNFRSK